MHVAQKPQFSEHEANLFLDGFRTAILVYNIADRNVVNMNKSTSFNLIGEFTFGQKKSHTLGW